MRIQHNIPAMNAYRNYSANVSALQKNLEKLSTGYKINRAGDDAAGLAISEKMRAQIAGLEQAQSNAKSGINLVQTAEGAMTEVHSMLNRMYTLAEQSSNGTYSDEVDREQLQKEVDQLRTEINRIADASNFNGIKLLDGSLEKRAAGSKVNTVSGMDRIITTLLKDGEVPHQVAGNRTILSEAGSAKGTAGVIKINLTTLDVRFNGSGSASSGAVSLKLTIGDGELTLVASDVGKDSNQITQLELASGVATSADATGGFLKINGVDWFVNWTSGRLTITQKEPPTTEEATKTNFDVSVAAGDKATLVKQEANVGVSTHKIARVKGGGNLANTVFEMSEKDIVDGATITIGTKTVTLAVGKDSKTTGDNLVDLKSMEADNIDLNKALAAISIMFGSTTINGTQKSSNGNVTGTLLVGVNDGSNGGPIGLTVQESGTKPAGTAGSAVYTSLEKLGAEFKMSSTETWKKSDGLTLQIGDTADDYNKMNVTVKDMHTEAMGIGKIDISTQEGASDAMKKIYDAINYVSDNRGTLGALQNRLEHTINNLGVMQENIQDAEANIRDVDIAKEMMAYTKNNILVQSAQAMLAQANQLPQGVLQLLG